MPPDQSLLLYARAYDLVEDHTSISPLSFICLPFDTDDESIDTHTLLAELKNQLQSLHLGSIKILKDPLEVTKDVGTLLSKTISPQKYREDEGIYTEAWDSLRIEEPILRFESVFTLDNSSASALKGMIDLRRLAVREADVDNDLDEGLLFPAWAWERGNDIMQDVAGDKMTVERGVLEYLRRIVKVPAVDFAVPDDGEKLNDFDNAKPTTPPLLPLASPASPTSSLSFKTLFDSFEPFYITEEGLKPFDDDPNSMVGEESLDVTPTTDRILRQIRTPTQITPSPAKSNFGELHIETPLTPPFTSPIPHNISQSLINKNSPNVSPTLNLDYPDQPRKRVKFSDEIGEFIFPPSFDPSEEGKEEETTQDLLTKSAMAEFAMGVMEPGARYFLMKLQQEQLEDSAGPRNGSRDGLQVAVPIVDWERPVPVWVSGRGLAGALEYNVGEDEDVLEKWDYRKSLDISGLQWSIGRPVDSENETILPADEDEWWTLSGNIFPTAPIETIIEDEDEAFWKGETEKREDDELETMKIPPKMDLDSLVERRKQKRSNINNSSEKPRPSIFDSRSNLSSFLSLQNRAFEGPSIFESWQEPQTPLSTESPITAPSSVKTPTINHPPNVGKSPPEDPASSFIISTSLLANRALYRNIKSLCPKSTFIERDFDSSYIINMFGERDQVPGEPTDEADIIVSPLAGIIITNLQTIRQRPLPGKPPFQAPVSAAALPKGIRDRIMKISERYERLVVCVSVDIGGAGAEDLSLGKADYGIIAGFVGFCEALGNVHVEVMKGGRSMENMGRWIVDNLAIHSKKWKEAGLAVQISERETLVCYVLASVDGDSFGLIVTGIFDSGKPFFVRRE
ncbi:hypothetical protein TWF694_001402 [Orbilia ellipsospora]|uniref:DUF7102 domain-containing protein n=1 Tax=Orbilia ellipsospora TaxID=2528407 RepID=A0AAV9XTC7_9PEZI